MGAKEIEAIKLNYEYSAVTVFMQIGTNRNEGGGGLSLKKKFPRVALCLSGETSWRLRESQGSLGSSG